MTDRKSSTADHEDEDVAKLIAERNALRDVLKQAQDSLCLFHCQTATKTMQGKHTKICNTISAVLGINKMVDAFKLESAKHREEK
jgi:hypothetical protein